MSFLSILILIFAPAIVALFILSPVFPNNEIKIRRFSKIFGIIHFIYSTLFLIFFNPTNFGWSYQKELTFFKTSWLKPLGLTATFGMDGISLSFVILVSFLVMLVLIASKSMIRTKHRIYYPLVLVIETAFLGTLCAKDIFLFFVFWGLEFVPLYFLISQWGDKTSAISANKYFSYMVFSSVFMLLGMMVLYFYSFSINGVLTADIESLSVSENVFTFWFQAFIFFCLLFGFCVKVPFVPFHNWFVNSLTEAVTPVSMLIAGILPVVSCYGIIRFNLGLFPEVFEVFAPLLIIWGVVNLLYGAVLAIVQTDIKKIVAYAGVSQTGLVLAGLGALIEAGFNGAVFQILAQSLILAGLIMLAGIIYLRTKTREITALGGLAQVMPICAGLGSVIALGLAGIPFTIGFLSKFMILSGIALSDIEPQRFVALMFGLTILGLILTGIYVTNMFHKIFFGPVLEQFRPNAVQYDDNGQEILVVYPKRGITKSEIVVLGLLAFAVIGFGVFPNAVLDVFQVTSDIIFDFIKV